MNTANKSDAEKQTEESKLQAMQDAKTNQKHKPHSDETIHTINPFTGTEMNITPEDLEGIEKQNEANSERD